MCADTQNSSKDAPVPDFEKVGFGSGGGHTANAMTEAHAALGDVRALRLSVCVGASYDSATNAICFTIPIYGHLCVTSPIPIPASASLKACAETCSHLGLPTGLKVSIYLNDSPDPIYSGTVLGYC